jgi:glycosidase
MISSAQQEKIYYLSDMVLYEEAVGLIRSLKDRDGRPQPLPTSQVKGLWNIANASSTYSGLTEFIVHQKLRDWQPSKRFLGSFYTELERVFNQMRNQRLRTEFRLLNERDRSQSISEQADEIMILLAREFIQHLVTENLLIEAERKDREQAQRKVSPQKRSR